MPPSPLAPPISPLRRAARAAELARGADHFHEPRREDCPWCGSRRLRTRLRTPDLLRRGPGVFVLDECRDCAHTFQNPRLTAEGRAFYDCSGGSGYDCSGCSGCYDGSGCFDPEAHGAVTGVLDRLTARVLAARATRRRLRAAARALPGRGEPESWLDVGTGDAGFPLVARQVFPYTSFDGLDATPRVVRARDAGRVEEAHVGRLADPALTARLRARYDVVSMFHHLPRTPDPRAELRAALAVLRPGGHLLIDLPDPRSAPARLLGRHWAGHGQPHHLHLPRPANVRAELESHGCTVLAVGRRAAHVPHDLSAAVLLALCGVLPAGDAPWRPAPPTLLRRGVRAAVTYAALPVLAAALTLDHLLAPVARGTCLANGYRIIARTP
jgi:SAM-dependent methyltransferase